MCCIWEKFGQICGIFGAWPKAVRLWSLDCLIWLRGGQWVHCWANKQDLTGHCNGRLVGCNAVPYFSVVQLEPRIDWTLQCFQPSWRWHLVRLASWRIWLVGPASVRNAIMRCLGKLVPCWGNILKVSSWSTLCVWFISAVSLYSKIREERARGVPTKEHAVFMERFFFQMQHVNPALEANVS